MYSILLALVVIRRHLAKIGRIDIYQRIYYELQNLNLEDESSINRTIEVIKTLLSDNASLAMMIIHLINQYKPESSEQSMSMAGDFLCHKPPELSNVSHQILKVVQKILPKKTENPINTNQILQPLSCSTHGTNEMSTNTAAQMNVPATTFSPMIFTISKNVTSPVSSNNSTSQASSSVIKLVQVGKMIQSTGKNLRVLSLYDNSMEVHPTLPSKSILKKVSTPISKPTHLYTINNMKMACLSNKITGPTTTTTTTSTAPKVNNSSVIDKPLKPNNNQPNTIQTLLTAAQVVNKMSILKGKQGMQTGMPITVLCGAKNPSNSGVLSALANVINSQNRTQLGIPGAQAVTTPEKIPSYSCEPLDFSIPKNLRHSPCNSLINMCKGEKDEEEDDDELIVVDDDDRYVPDDKDCKVELEEIVLKNEPISLENSFDADSVCQSGDEVDDDQSHRLAPKRRRKRNFSGD